jgi:hypothetical protein
MKCKVLIGAAVVCAAIFLFESAFGAQTQRTVMEGVYTNTQADRGSAIVELVGCSACHGDHLAGGVEETPPLVGPDFVGSWSGRTLGDLFQQVNTMPPDGSFKITPEGYVDVIAFLLRSNGYPTGKSEIVPDTAVLSQIKIVLP